jgi:hypothetical protein
MTTDMENEIRTLLREKADEAPISTPSAAPQRVLRRGRAHQMGTVLGSAALVVVLIVGSVAGLTRILGEGREDVTGDGGYEVFERTATVEAFTVTSPSDWYLVNEWPLSMQIAVETSGGASSPCVAEPGNTTEECKESGEVTSSRVPVPHGLPMLQLSNVDTGLGSIACRDGLPNSAAVLYIAMDPGGALAPDGASLEPYPIGPGLPAPVDSGPCGPGTYAHFTVNGTPMFFWIGVGDGATGEDRAAVRRTAEMMYADDAWEPSPPDHVTPAYVIAGGVADDGEPWRLDLRPGERSPELFLEGVDASLLGVEPRRGQDTVVPAIPIEWCCRTDAGLLEVTFGFVTKGAWGIQLRPSDGAASIPGTILPLPPSLATLDADVFFIDGTRGLEGEVKANGLANDPTEPPVAEPRGEAVELSGTFRGQPWRARFAGSFADESACIRVTVQETYEPLCQTQLDTSLAGTQPSMHGWVTTNLHLLAGSVPPDVVEIRFKSDGGTNTPTQFECRMGPLGWTDPDRTVCALALPPEGSGVFEYLDSDGTVLFEEGMGWGSAAATSHEYPWTNVGGTITAQGSFQGASWMVEVLYYRDGYRLSIDGREVFEGILREGEPVVFPLFEGDRGRFDALLLLVDGAVFGQDMVVASERIWAGRWLPGSTANGGKARLWLVELPGAGTGALVLDGVDRGPVSWP